MAHIITDAEAQSLVKIANSIIGPLVNQRLIKKDDMPDAVQELLAEAVRLSDSYDENMAAEFTTFAHGVMQNMAFRVVRKLHSPTTKMLTDAIPIDVIIDAEDSDDTPDYRHIDLALSAYDPAEEKAEYLSQKRILIVQTVMSQLNREQVRICKMLMKGITITEICQKMKLSRKAVRIRISTIKQAMIDAGIDLEKPKKTKIFQKTGAKTQSAWQ